MSKPFFVFEGVDGAGKSSISAKVAQALNARHIESPIGNFRDVRKHVDSTFDNNGRFYFYLASNIFLSQFVKDERKRESVLCARYIHSTLIGHATRQNEDITEYYDKLEFPLISLEQPSLTFFLYVSQHKQRERLMSRPKHELSSLDLKCLDQGNDYNQLLMENYLHVARNEGWIIINTDNLSEDAVVLECVRICLEFEKTYSSSVDRCI